MKTCPILECKINSINKMVKCQYCEFFSCISCFETFLKQKDIPQCMSCKKVWTEEYIDDVFNKSFKKKLKEKQKLIIFDREKAMIPETMIELEKIKKKEIINNKIYLLRNQISVLEKEIRDINIYYEHKDKDETIKKIKIIKQCPNKKCNGYLNNKYKCIICETKLCLDCEKIKNDNHICEKEDIDTVLLKKKECKYCPTCSFETFKDGGCYMVWCPPPCNEGKGTAWNFNTGEIEKGPIHTPLYYEYMRKNGNNNINNPINCQNRNYLPDIWRIYNNNNNNDHPYNIAEVNLFEIHRKVSEIKSVYIRKYKINDEIPFNINLDLRLKFLNNEIDEKNFKKNLLIRHNKDKKIRKIYENLEMLYNVCYDIFDKLVNFSGRYNFLENIDIALIELESVREYYNNSIKKTKEIIGCKSLNISNLNKSWNFTY